MPSFRRVARPWALEEHPDRRRAIQRMGSAPIRWSGWAFREGSRPGGERHVKERTAITSVAAASGPSVFHRPLIPIVIALATGIWIGGTWPGHLPWMAAAGIPALAWVAWSRRRERSSTLAPLFLMAILGYALISPWRPSAFPETHVSHFTDSHHWQIEGRVAERLPDRHGRLRLVLEVARLQDGRTTIPASGRIRVTVAQAPGPIPLGAQLSFASRIRSFRNFNNPGGFDYRRYMAFQRICGSAFVGGDRLQITPVENDGGGSALRSYRMRARRLVERYPDSDTQAILKALLIGDREAITQELRQVFNRCGVGHLLAISGLHIGIVGGFVFGVGLWLMHRLPFILDRGWGRRGATLVAVGPVVFYAFLAGLSPATQRALIMVLAFMVTYFVHRDGDTLNFLALAALLMLIAMPPALFSISFQMSFAAVFWIVMGLAPRREPPPGDRERNAGWRQRVIAFMMVTFWATAGTLPITMRYFQEVSLVGLLANCFMVPLTGLFVLPVGLVALLVLTFHGDLAGWGIRMAGWGLERGLDLLQMISAFDAAALQTFVPTPFEMLCYYMALGLLLTRRSLKVRRWGMPLLIALLCADGLYWGYQRHWHRDLRVTVLDVGQGSAALVEFPGGATMLVDGGGFTDNRYFDVGARIVAPFLRYRKILQVDTIVLSHPSSDHMNGLVYILAHFHPKRVLWTGDGAPTLSFRRFYQALAQSGAEVSPWPATERRLRIGDAAVDILGPPPIAPRSGAAAEAYNNRSVVLKVRLGACAILFPGDIEAEAEAALVARCRAKLPSQVLVAPHHGSRTSSTAGFIEAVAPRAVVFSAGWSNRFGFPHPVVVERYQRRDCQLFRTDAHGAVSLRTWGRRWQVQTQME